MKINSAFRLLVTSHKQDEVWKNGVRGYHNAAGAVILALDTGRILLQLRAADSDTPNTYGQFGGSLDNNEDVNDGLRREIREETGYAGPLKIRPLTPFRDPAKGFVYYNNLAVVPKEFVFAPPAEFAKESGGHLWFDPRAAWPAPRHPGLDWLIEEGSLYKALAYFLG
ncbi:MutT/NUDIX hydrolase family protein [Ralstonia phage phiRSL1]|uniref:MutT/NUDIX hydrolase family protein n=1 Tax=Ralstonia phage phiRSL1 TaxID=1980924 RepID=B2ZXX7_9CAUD|nr:MutT/NUDIX hydrolase [Ralstonia phage phiRSL1]BAG41553.1 MutT/NUDIX hydrolase family protein [Ralstonia phage phiRSL1]